MIQRVSFLFLLMSFGDDSEAQAEIAVLILLLFQTDATCAELAIFVVMRLLYIQLIQQAILSDKAGILRLRCVSYTPETGEVHPSNCKEMRCASPLTY
jgi:hypothetical protein